MTERTAAADADALEFGGADIAPLLSPNPEGAPFWHALAEQRLKLQRCAGCGRLIFYPRGICPHCGGRDLHWEELSGRGTLYSFCVHYRTFLPALEPALPFATALVDLSEGPRVTGFLVGVPNDPDRIRCGIGVHAEFRAVADGIGALAFRPDR